ncbi:signal recognition particle 14 kDa protein isoform X3 [Amborella trichopoda]|uniref:signal recognition particle 14 kDa protein isoform X3 n=1 Tax=Amborella trichopoda TaxID=13333 RepID=UPI0009BE2B73|nr:signal recognition particle 14 kDa protein isoform X3 [Amborella trichopoda]|eukprot:XP_020517839.1 signal recognition particle 14 kDa protein isoform X3 [Amborella trichopoda]
MFSTVSIVVLLQPDPFLNELTNMYERNREKGSVWVTLKRSSLKSKRKRKVEYATDVVDFRCLVRATDGKKTISTSKPPPLQRLCSLRLFQQLGFFVVSSFS